jgi:hypothetical protein
MTSLESIVLPLAESRALVEAGVVLETALVWVPAGEFDEYEDGESREPVLMEKKDTLDEDDGPMYEFTPAPVLSELLDAIRAKVGDAEFHSYNVNTVIDIGNRTWEVLGDYIGVARRYKIVERAPALTDLLAAAALLMGVSR